MNFLNLTAAANTLWMLACRRSLGQLRRCQSRVKVTQERVLNEIVAANSRCAFGRQHDFATLRSVDDFRKRVPLADYEDIRPWVDRICRGEPAVLTSAPVRLLEPTSGSVSGRKLIPYTATLQRQFQNCINAWIADLFSARPVLRSGRAYWSMSPPAPEERTVGGLPIGFAEDTQYLGPVTRLIARHVMAVPPHTMNRVSPEDAMYRTLLQLLTVPDLTLISVWSPTFLTTLMRELNSSHERLVDDLRRAGNTRHAVRVGRIMKSSTDLSEQLEQLWPNLQLISCWADGAAAHGINDLQSMFPEVEIQPKGLISTEAFVSLPMIGHEGSLLSLRSHFFEFQAEDSSNEATLLAHELTIGGRYRVIVTTGGGLYRYRTHDVVEVVGHQQQCPRIRFCGRDNRTSDLVGEKLTDVFVGRAIARTMQLLRLQPTFAMLTPDSSLSGYRLLLDLPSADKRQINPVAIAAAVEVQLSENPWYKHARSINQLGPLDIAISEPANRWCDVYSTRCEAIGIRRGDIKPSALSVQELCDRS